MVKATNKKRLKEMESELSYCHVDRFRSDLLEISQNYPDLESMRREYAEYVSSQREMAQVPTYFHYWEEEETRRMMWVITQDPIARAMMEKFNKAKKRVLDSKNRMKRVGDGTHEPVEEPLIDPND
jgi:hypothetical protein